MIWLIFDAVKFVATQAHGMYADPRFALWGGMTAVDHATSVIRRTAPQGCTLFLLPGTWSNWDQLFNSTSQPDSRAHEYFPSAGVAHRGDGRQARRRLLRTDP